jgi:thiol:disulfide interchange protein DsbA
MTRWENPTMSRLKLNHFAWVFALLMGLVATVNAQDSIKGKYELVQPPQATETPGKIEVVDIFWYGCPHCYRFLPSIESYQKDKADYVEIRRLPAIFSKGWEMHARAYYTAKVLGVIDELHVPIFEAINKDGQKLNDKDSLRSFFVKHGVSAEDFDKTFESFAVSTLMRKSLIMQSRYGVRGTPSVIINGKYRTSGSLAGNYKEMIRVIKELAKREQTAGSIAS